MNVTFERTTTTTKNKHLLVCLTNFRAFWYLKVHFCFGFEIGAL